MAQIIVTIDIEDGCHNAILSAASDLCRDVEIEGAHAEISFRYSTEETLSMAEALLDRIAEGLRSLPDAAICLLSNGGEFDRVRMAVRSARRREMAGGETT